MTDDLTARDVDVIIEAAHPSRPDRHELTRAAVERIVADRTADADSRLADVVALLADWSDFEHDAATCPKYVCGDCTMINACYDLSKALRQHT